MRPVVRSLFRRPIYSLAAILTVAVAIGANTALFGVIYAVLIQPLPFRDPSKLVQVWETHPALPQLQVTVPDFEDWRSRTHSFDQMAAHTLSAMNTGTLLGQGSPEMVHATMASSNLFPMMGIEPLTGRVFTNEEERTRQPLALMSESLWRRKFGADPGTIGRQVHLGFDSFRIVGIVPQRQAFPEWADLWIPLSLIEPDLKDRRKYHPLEVIARLKSGVTPDQAQVEIQAIARQLSEAFPETNATVGAYVIPLARELTKDIRPSLLLAWGAVGLVLLMACANLAHLFMARMLERSHEMRIREALGARASHLVSQVMMESLLIALIGGAVGFGLGVWASKFAPSLDPRVERTRFDPPVLLFALVLAVICGVLFGLPACWQVMRRRATRAGSGRSVIQME